MTTSDTMPDEFVFDWEYSEDVLLEDGTPVRLRLLRPDDRDRLRAAFRRLSDESRYRRFLSAKSSLSERELDYLCEVDQFHHVALGAELREGERAGHGIGIARCVRLQDASATAEAAVTVVDDFQHRGLGRMMLERLVAAALERGIDTFRATLFRENDSMRTLLERIGTELEVVERDGPVVTVDVQLTGEEPSLPTVAEPRELEIPRDNPLRSILSMAAEGVVSLVEKIRPWRSGPSADADDPGDECTEREDSP